MHRSIRRFSLAIAFACISVVFTSTLLFASEPKGDADKLAKTLTDRSGVQRGVCAVVDDDADLALAVARSSGMLVHLRTPNADNVAALRKQASDAGFGIDRVVVDSGPTNRLPYIDNMIDVLILSNPGDGDAPSIQELLRVLRPRGSAFLPNVSEEQILQVVAVRGAVHTKRNDPWAQIISPALKGAGNWSHWEHGPDNNPVSEDQIIKFPYMTQFLADPLYIAMPSITVAAGGRTFLAIGHIAHHRREWDFMNKLIARNGYNGTVLWERKLPEGYMVHRSAFIATDDVFYMADGDRALMLDPETGKELGRIEIPGVEGQWKWMVLDKGVLYVLAGDNDPAAESMKGDRSFGGWSWGDLSQGYYQKPRVPWGFGHSLAAYDVEKKKILWKHIEQEKPIDSRSLSMGKEKVFLYCPDAYLRCLDRENGEVLWTNKEKEVLDLIEEPGKGLTSTPGWRSQTLAVYTPEAVILQGQTRQNVVAISTSDGYMLWNRQKVTNNPNAIFVDGRVILGVGKGGSHVALEPTTGNVLEDLGFTKRACTRLTCSTDSFFVRGEGTLRYDRETKKVQVDGAIRPACNDGALPANGLLYLGPWQCDCNLSLIGNMARTSAGDFRFDFEATEEQRLETAADAENVDELQITDADWPTFRGNNERSGSTSTKVSQRVAPKWQYRPDKAYTPTPPVAAGGLVFQSSSDGKTRALDAKSGQVKWEFATPAPIKQPPTVAENRTYFGSGDGYAYAVEAASGKLLWRFRAAPVERQVMVYGNLCSTWPVNSGVLVEDGTAYFAAGIIDHDGTYVYAVDAKTGEIQWQNNSSGHLNAELRKGVSVQGNLSIHGDRLLLAGGNQVSPAPFDRKTGECLAPTFGQGQPKTNNGQFVGVFMDAYPLVGGRILYSAAQNVSTKGSFTAFRQNQGLTLNYGGIPPAWDDNAVAMVNFKHGKLTCCDAGGVKERMQKGLPQAAPDRRRRGSLADAFADDGAIRWQSDLGESNKFEAVALTVCPNAIVAAVQFQQQFRAQPQWYVVAFNSQNGNTFWRHELQGEPLPGGLLVDRDGQVIVTLLDGGVLCLGPAG